jgi:prefoldin subunit 5
MNRTIPSNSNINASTTSMSRSSRDGDADADPMNVMQQKIYRYTSFLTNRLQPDLHHITQRIDRYNTLLQSWIQLKHTLNIMNIGGEVNRNRHLDDDDQSISTMYNIGSDFYMQAKIRQEALQQNVSINIGLNYYIEMSLSEAFKFIELKQRSIEETIRKHEELAAKIRTNIKTVYAGIGELIELQKEGNK